MAPFMINCKEYSELISKGLDRPLSFWDKVSVKMHDLICPPCVHVKKQFTTLGQLCRFVPSEGDSNLDESKALPDDACARIKAALKKVSDNSSP